MNERQRYAELKGIKSEKYPVNTNDLVAKVALSPGFIIMTILGITLWIMILIQDIVGFSLDSLGDLFTKPISIVNFFLLTPWLLPFGILIIGEVCFIINATLKRDCLSMSGITLMGIAFKIQMIIQIIITIITTFLMMYVLGQVNKVVKLGVWYWLILLTYIVVMVCTIVMFGALHERTFIFKFMLKTGMVVSDALPTFPAIMCFIMCTLFIGGMIVSGMIKDWFMLFVMLVEIFYYGLAGIVMIYNKICFVEVKRKIINAINN